MINNGFFKMYFIKARENCAYILNIIYSIIIINDIMYKYFNIKFINLKIIILNIYYKFYYCIIILIYI